jgi:dethiobiotin synthetase
MNAMGRGLFVTGTDTGVGKTEVACALLRAFVRRGALVTGMKPVAVGAVLKKGMLQNDDVASLRRFGNVEVPAALINPYLFAAPIAPHLAAADGGVRISLGVVTRAYRRLTRYADVVVTEGVGGFCVPLSKHHDTADLAQRLDLPVVLVVGLRLGCLSHALLTAAAIRARALSLCGWVANRIDPRMRAVQANVDALNERLDAPLLGQIGYCVRRRERQRLIDAALVSTGAIEHLAGVLRLAHRPWDSA